MLFELRTYELQPGRALEYLDLFRTMGVERVTKYLPMGGYWLTDSGRLNTIHHLWIYQSIAERAECRAEFAADKPWTEEFVPKAFPLIQRQQTAFLALETGSPELDAAIDRRKKEIPAQRMGERIFADGLLRLSVSRAPMPRDPVAVVADWMVISGEGVGSCVRLERVTGDEALKAPTESLERSELLRPLAISPIV
ncbi:MAG: NIPSNAP family protein [Oricola sp.]